MSAITFTAPAPRLRLTRRGRSVFVTLAAAPLVVGAFWFALNGGGATATLEGRAGEYATVTVQPGDTLWSIAETVAPASDPRDVIIELMQFNGLTTADVPAGFELAIPPRY
jgi:hypothetical protein